MQDALSTDKQATVSVGDISIDKNTVSFHYTSSNASKNEVLNIALVQKQVTTHIKAGENEGITITNHNIVRAFETQSISNEGTGSVNLPAMFKSSEYALVLYVQNKNNLSITAATMKEL